RVQRRLCAVVCAVCASVVRVCGVIRGCCTAFGCVSDRSQRSGGTVARICEEPTAGRGSCGGAAATVCCCVCGVCECGAGVWSDPRLLHCVWLCERSIAA